MVELAIAVVAGAALLTLIAWHERGATDWEVLLSPEAREAWDFLRSKFEAEEKAATFATTACAAAAAEDFLAGLATDRVALLRRLEMYARAVAAAAPRHDRLQVQIQVLERAFAGLATRDAAAASVAFRDLDAQTLESCRLLAAAVAGMERAR
jgi:hypothetical protein